MHTVQHVVQRDVNQLTALSNIDRVETIGIRGQQLTVPSVYAQPAVHMPTKPVQLVYAKTLASPDTDVLGRDAWPTPLLSMAVALSLFLVKYLQKGGRARSR